MGRGAGSEIAQVCWRLRAGVLAPPRVVTPILCVLLCCACARPVAGASRLVAKVTSLERQWGALVAGVWGLLVVEPLDDGVRR